MGNKIVHWEIMGRDGAGLARFYDDLFGWAPTEAESFAGYHLVDGESAGLGGALGQIQDGPPNYLTVYVEVDSIDEYMDKVTGGGGAMVVPRTEVPGMVTFAQFRDPAGNIVGLVESEVPPAG